MEKKFLRTQQQQQRAINVSGTRYQNKWIFKTHNSQDNKSFVIEAIVKRHWITVSVFVHETINWVLITSENVFKSMKTILYFKMQPP